MASLTQAQNGSYIVQVVGQDGKRRSIRLGALPKKTAESVKLRIEALAACQVANVPMDAELAKWTANIGDDLAAKLSATGLMPARSSMTVGAFLEDYLTGRALSAKPTTLSNLSQARKHVEDFFGPETQLRSIGPVDAEKFYRHYLERKYAAETIHRYLKNVKLFFSTAMKRGLLETNPFENIAHPAGNASERQHYISLETTAKLLEVANLQWRLIIALARYGGLRCTSEVLGIQWKHINFQTSRMSVPSPKTEHKGKASREVPLFPLLRPILEEGYADAQRDAVYVVPGGLQNTCISADGRLSNCSLSSRFRRIIKRAGVEAWPRLFQNLRSSCETDLMQNHPIQVVTAWIGNTPAVAMKHYLQVLPRDFDIATGRNDAKSGAVGGEIDRNGMQNAVQSQTVLNSIESTKAHEEQGNCSKETVQASSSILETEHSNVPERS